MTGERIHLFIDSKQIMLIDNENKETFLTIDRSTLKSEFKNSKDFDMKDIKPLKFFCIFGSITARDVEFLVLVSKA